MKNHAINIADQFGTPLYIYNEAALRQAANECLAFNADFGLTVRFAMKANPNRSILQLFHSMGIQIDASSGYEAERAMLAGIPAENILLTVQEIPENFQELINAGVEFNACSLHQLEAYGQLERRPNTVSIRINPGKGSGQFPGMNVGGPGAGFGIWHEQIKQIQELLKRHNLSIQRVHTHIGCGTDPEIWTEVAKISISFMHTFTKATILNLGGGFKVSRVPEEKTADLAAISTKVNEILKKFAEETGRKIHLEIEPGSYLSANTGHLLSSVIDLVQTTEEHKFIKLNSGMTELIRPAMYGAQHPIEIIRKDQQESQEENFYVVGHCCETSDTFTVKKDVRGQLETRRLPRPEIGDLAIIGGVGGYCSSMATINYNSFPQAAEVMVHEDGTYKLIRRRQSMDQMLQNEVSP